MDDLQSQSTHDLVMRLNHIRVEQDQLSIEYNRIIHELHRRYTDLKKDPDLQPQILEDDPLWGKVLVRRKEDDRSLR